MKRIIVALFISISILSLTIAPASAQAQPLYALAFPHDGHVSVATLMSDQTWRLRTFDNSYFGLGDLFLVDPVWSADGQTLYMTAFPPDDSVQARDIYQYDVNTDQYTQVVQLPKIGNGPDWAQLEGLSPDGRYLRVSRDMTLTADLIDLQAPTGQQVIPQNLQCPSRLVHWTQSYLVTYQYMCEFIGTQIQDAAGNALIFDPSLNGQSSALSEDLYDQWYEIPSSIPYLLAGSSYRSTSDVQIVRVDPKAQAETVVAQGGQLFVSADKRFAAFVSNGRLIRINLRTGEQEDTGPAGDIRAVGGTVDSALHLWNVSTTPEQTAVEQITLTATARTDTPFYTLAPTPDHAPFNYISVAPQGNAFALIYNATPDALVTEVYDQTTLRWSSKHLVSPMTVHENTYSQITWSADGKWYFQPVTTQPGEYRTVGIEVATGNTTLLPEANAYFLTSSPDSVWWLYAILTDDQLHSSKPFTADLEAPLMAFNHVTGETVALGGQALVAYQGDDQQTRYFQVRRYQWSTPNP